MSRIFLITSMALLGLSTPGLAQVSDATTTVIEGALLEDLISTNTGDNPVRVVDSEDGQYGVFLLTSEVRPAPAEGIVNGGYHSSIGEIYHVISGTGTFVTGGELVDPVSVPEDTLRYTRAGPGESGMLRNAELVAYGPGSIFIVPAGVPHNASHEVSTKTVFIVYRFDPDRVLPPH